MKIELQIAEKNWDEIQKNRFKKEKERDLNILINRAEEHKQSCERFLEFCKTLVFNTREFFEGRVLKKNIKVRKMIKERISDLEQAIKLYKDAGI